jgi:hypothetical protein
MPAWCGRVGRARGGCDPDRGVHQDVGRGLVPAAVYATPHSHAAADPAVSGLIADREEAGDEPPPYVEKHSAFAGSGWDPPGGGDGRGTGTGTGTGTVDSLSSEEAGDEPPPYVEKHSGSTSRSMARRWMPCPWPREVTSTVTEHETVAAREHVSTNAPGRIEGSREHSNLAVTPERNMHRHDVRVLTSRVTPSSSDDSGVGSSRRTEPARRACHVV